MTAASTVAAVSPGSDDGDKSEWTGGKVVLALVLFLAAGLAEIGGGWLVWQTIRCRTPLTRTPRLAICLCLDGFEAPE